MTQQTPFEKWWYEEGSQAPYTHHDFEEHTKRMCEMAWANGAYKEREACLKICEAQAQTNYWEGADVCAEDIRARGEA